MSAISEEDQPPAGARRLRADARRNRDRLIAAAAAAFAEHGVNASLEDIARRELGLIRPGEKLFILKDVK